MNRVSINGHCPACGEPRLFAEWVSEDEAIVVCDGPICTEVDLVQRLLDKPDQHVHLVDFREDGFTIQHPLAERVKPEALFACVLTDDFRALTEPPGIGLFRIPVGGSLADAEEVDRDSVLFEMPSAPPSLEVEHHPDVTNLVPVGAVMAVPEQVPLPDNCVEAEREIRLPRVDYPELGAILEAGGFDSVMIDGVEHVAVDLPEQATTPPEGVRYVLRVK